MQAAWWYLVGDSPRGPVSMEALEAMLQQGEMTQQSLIWKEGLSDWIAVAELSGLRKADVQVRSALPANLARRGVSNPRNPLWGFLPGAVTVFAMHITQRLLGATVPGFASWYQSALGQLSFALMFGMEAGILMWFFGPIRRQMLITARQDAWWFWMRGSLHGPVSMKMLDLLLQQGVMAPQSLVCREGLNHWLPMLELSSARKAGALQVEPDSLLDLAPAGAWRRFLARMLDLWVIGLAIALPGWLLLLEIPGFGLWFLRPSSPFLLSLCLLPLAMLVEAGLFARFGTTPGKALLGVVVLTLDGQRPTAAQYLRRQLGVFFYGLAMGLPLLSLVAMAAQGLGLQHGDPTPYDLNRFTVRARPLNTHFARWFGWGGCILCVLILVQLYQGY